MISRRTFLQSAATAAAGIAPFLQVKPIVASQIRHAQLGDKITYFSMEFGSAQRDGDFLVYGNRNDDLADYWVSTDGGDLAEIVEIDFSPLPNGGLLSTPDNLGVSRFIRDDARAMNDPILLGSLNTTRHCFYLNAWSSASLAADLGRSGVAFVVDEAPSKASYTPIGDWHILRTQVAMERFEVNDIMRTGELPGPASMLADWQNTFQMDVGIKSFHSTVLDPIYAGDWRVSDLLDEVDISFNPPISTAQSAGLIGQMLPASGATEYFTTFIPPTPNGPYGLRINRYNLGADGWPHWVLQYISGGEQSGTVDRIVMRATPE